MIVLDNKTTMNINFSFRIGAKKIRSFGSSVAKLYPVSAKVRVHCNWLIKRYIKTKIVL